MTPEVARRLVQTGVRFVEVSFNLNFINGKPDVLKRFLAAYSDTLDWMYKGDQSLQLFSEIFKVPLAEIR